MMSVKLRVDVDVDVECYEEGSAPQTRSVSPFKFLCAFFSHVHEIGVLPERDASSTFALRTEDEHQPRDPTDREQRGADRAGRLGAHVDQRDQRHAERRLCDLRFTDAPDLRRRRARRRYSLIKRPRLVLRKSSLPAGTPR